MAGNPLERRAMVRGTCVMCQYPDDDHWYERMVLGGIGDGRPWNDAQPLFVIERERYVGMHLCHKACDVRGPEKCVATASCR